MDGSFLVPKYSNCVEGALKFIQYYYSDEGLATYMNNTNTPAFAKFAYESKNSSTPNIIFAIFRQEGWDKKIRTRANYNRC